MEIFHVKAYSINNDIKWLGIKVVFLLGKSREVVRHDSVVLMELAMEGIIYKMTDTFCSESKISFALCTVLLCF